MPDIAEVLRAAADQVEVHDLLDRVHTGVRRRQRRRMIAAATGSAVLVAAVIVGAVGLAGRSDTKPAHKTPPKPAATKPLSLKARLPRYLPPGVHLARQGPGGPPELPDAAYHAVYAANGAAITFTIVNDDELTKCHVLRRVPTRSVHVPYPCAPDDGWLHTFDPLASGYSQQVNGESGYLADPPNDIGPQDVEWREGVYHYYLEEIRLTPGGGAPNGVVFRQLVRMANSVPVDPTVPTTVPVPNPPSATFPAGFFGGLHRGRRILVDNDGADITFTSHHVNLEVTIQPTTAQDGAASTGLSIDRDVSVWRNDHFHFTKVTVRGESATAWTHHSQWVGLLCTVGDYKVEIQRDGKTTAVADLVRVAKALRIVPHSP